MMLDGHREQMRQYLVVAEGLRLKPYWDCCGRTLRQSCTNGGVHLGKLTVGVGRNIEDVGLTALESYHLLENDVDRAIAQVVSRYPWIEEHNEARQAALVELMFNMGPETLKQFVNTLAAFRMKDYPKAAEGLKKSKWYRQVSSSRSGRIIGMIESGEFA